MSGGRVPAANRSLRFSASRVEAAVLYAHAVHCGDGSHLRMPAQTMLDALQLDLIDYDNDLTDEGKEVIGVSP